MRSWSNRILSVRRVTQDDQGKKTAGVDWAKSLSPAERLELANPNRLEEFGYQNQEEPEKRPLGIPVI